MRLMILTFAALSIAAHAEGAIQTRAVEYRDGETVLEGFLAWDDAREGRRPGVLVVHEWTGLGDYVRSRSMKLAELGYLAFAADIYGKGVRPQTPQAAAAQAGIYKKDRQLMRRRAQAGLAVLRRQELCDPGRVAAIGYCFGGTVVLELARSGADVGGVVSFHGGLETPNPRDARNIKGKVLALHGADDPHVPRTEVEAFQDEMRRGHVDWQMVIYGNAVHSFTNPAAGSDNAKGVAYNAAADRRSWQAMKDFFGELFQR